MTAAHSVQARPSRLQQLGLAYVVVWALSPALAYGDVYRAIAVGAVLLWAAVELTRSRNIITQPTLGVLVAGVYIIYTLCIEFQVPNADGVAVTRHFQVWILLFFLIIHDSQRREISSLRYLFWISLVILPVWLVVTLQAYEDIGRNASRIVIRSSEEARELSAQGVGGYGLVYSVVVAIPILALFVLRPKRVNWEAVTSSRWLRRAAWLLMAVNLLLSLLVVIKAGYSLALIITAASLVILFSIRGRDVGSVFRVLLLSGVVVVGAVLMVEPAMELAAEVTHGTMYQRKAEDLRATFLYDSAIGTVADRTERYDRSIGLFFEHPIMGTLTRDDVGKHSAYIDRFAQYGVLFGGIFMYLMLAVPLRFARSLGADFGLSLSVLFIVIAFPMLNNVFAAFGFMIFIFYPAAMTMLKAAPTASAAPIAHHARVSREGFNGLVKAR